MKNLILILMCCLFRTIAVFSYEEKQEEGLLLSTPEQVASLTSEPSYLIGGVISPLSRQSVSASLLFCPFLSTNDMLAHSLLHLRKIEAPSSKFIVFLNRC